MNIIQQFTASKETINNMVAQTVNEVKEGNLNPLNVLVAIKVMEKVIEDINKQTKDYQLTEAFKYNQKSFESFGAKIEIAELGTSYNYDECNDTELAELMIQEKLIKDKIKERQTFLRALKKPTELYLGEGEIHTVYPPVKSSKTGLKVTI